MPLVRRIPKRGFKPFRRSKVKRAIVNLEDLNRFPEGTLIDRVRLANEGLIPSTRVKVKILGQGELTRPLTVQAHGFSASALAKIASAGGKAEKASGG